MDNLKKSQKAVIVSAIISFFLLSLKFVIGIISNSIVLISDALDNLTDFLAMIGAYVGIRISKKKPSNDYHYGYGKAQNIVSLIISLIIIVSAINLIRVSIDSIVSVNVLKYNYFVYFSIFLSIIFSLFLYFYLNKKSKVLKSELLLISSKERLADVLKGVIIAGSIYFHEMGYFFAQGIISIIICVAVFYIGIKSLILSINSLMDKSPDKDIIILVEKLLKDEKNIKSFKNLRLKKSGPFIFGDVEIKVDSKYSIKKAHNIADCVEKKIKKECENIISFIIHVEPF